jgi:hypothetical protein
MKSSWRSLTGLGGGAAWSGGGRVSNGVGDFDTIDAVRQP